MLKLHHGSQGSDQAVDGQLAGKRSAPVLRLDQANRLQHAKRVANRSAAHSKLFGQDALRGQRQSLRKRAVQD